MPDRRSTSSSASPAPTAQAWFTEVYPRLKAMAHRELGRGAAGRSLDTTALVHELYVKVCAGRDLEFAETRQFFAYAGRAMRHILVDRARSLARVKAGGDRHRFTWTESIGDAIAFNPEEALQLDAALDALEADDARAARVVELHYFAGLPRARVAEILGVAQRTVDRDWRYARAFLLARIT
ncbi:MAG TPA: ECF-type sigma factor [Rhodanobacteraceae bacterium]|nr:ECF-type sigma factor [Rhodanobacteraceae bacterium]